MDLAADFIDRHKEKAIAIPRQAQGKGNRMAEHSGLGGLAFGLLLKVLGPQQPMFYLRNSMILTFSSLLLQAPSLCSEKLSDEPL